jgi:group I intron endonuclease
MEKIYIYGLVDAINNELKYIGKSINPKSRYKKHLQDSIKKISYKDKWIYSLLEKNIKPELLIIDEVDNESWVFWEKHYISYYKSIGCKLTNLSEGGDNPPNHTGRKRTEDEIERIRKSNLGKKRNEETRKKMSDSKKGKPILHLNNGKERSLSHKKNLSLSLKGRKSPKKGKKYTEEHKKVLSEAHSHQKKQIVQMNLDGTIIKIWDSIADAKREYKNNHISECCSGKIKTTAGFIWRYYF